jgi:hypothetical protein
MIRSPGGIVRGRMQHHAEKHGSDRERRTTSVQTGARILLDFWVSCRDEIRDLFQQNLLVLAASHPYFAV